MDTSEQYVKQCEKANEIQKLITPGTLLHLLPKHIKGIRTWQECENVNKGITLDHEGNYFWIPRCIAPVVWLPRQDQLQIISGLSWRDFDIACQRYNTDTKEQAGIQVVMATNLKKKWLDNEWQLDNTI